MSNAARTFTEKHLLLSTALTVVGLLVFAVVFGLGLATLGVRAVEMALGSM